jgi:hypothetical protein
MKMPVFDFFRNMAIMCAIGALLVVLCVLKGLHPLAVIAALVVSGIALGPWRTTR